MWTQGDPNASTLCDTGSVTGTDLVLQGYDQCCGMRVLRRSWRTCDSTGSVMMPVLLIP